MPDDPVAGSRGSVLRSERSVKGDVGCCKVLRLDHLQRFGGAPLTVHAAIFPFDGQRAIVAEAVQGSDQAIPLHITMSWRNKVPPAAMIAKVKMAAQDAVSAVQL